MFLFKNLQLCKSPTNLPITNKAIKNNIQTTVNINRRIAQTQTHNIKTLIVSKIIILFYFQNSQFKEPNLARLLKVES